MSPSDASWSIVIISGSMGVADVRLVQDGPLPSGGGQAVYRVNGLIVVERHATQLFGYE
ncbi:hypothetical protein AB0P21_38915 [Kribbella sp. NPDC056861]|uniref:hypothetical protein n=1 Tax=Kribbella sp. NPDC056861 TaxID=3154857 RepID=UPI00341B7D82